MPRGAKYVKVEAFLVIDNGKALKIYQGEKGRSIWVGRSVCRHISIKPEDPNSLFRVVEIELEEWLAKKENLEYEELD